MTQEKVDMYIMSNSKYFPSESIPLIKEKMLSADESRYAMIQAAELKDPTTIMIVSVLLGSLGVDRFMLGDTGIGVLKLLTGGVCGILTIIDWFTVMKKAREKNRDKLLSIL